MRTMEAGKVDFAKLADAIGKADEDVCSSTLSTSIPGVCSALLMINSSNHS